MEETRIYENENGYIIDDIENSCIKVFSYGVCNYDGIIDKSLNENRYNYKTGLYQSWDSIGRYYANYFDKYKDKATVIESAKRDIKYIDWEKWEVKKLWILH